MGNGVPDSHAPVRVPVTTQQHLQLGAVAVQANAGVRGDVVDEPSPLQGTGVTQSRAGSKGGDVRVGGRRHVR